VTTMPKPGPRSHRLFWSISDLVREKHSTKGWAPREISFERSIAFRAAGHRWRAFCSIEFGFLGGAESCVYVFTDGRGRRSRITPRSAELEFFDTFAGDMRKLGYEGDWDIGLGRGPGAHFRKSLRSPASVRHEWEQLSRLRPGEAPERP
jgi:hypothetical protein